MRRATPLFWQIFATNALLLAVATAVLAFTPLTISFPVALTEVVVLVCGLGAMLLVNAALLRRAMRPLRQLGTTMRRIDPLHPGHRVAIDRADPEVEALSDTFNAMLDRLEDERRESARRALAAQEQERRRIARELHDEVGQSLTAVLLSLETASRELAPSDRPKLERTRTGVGDTLEAARAIAARLRPPVLDDLGLGNALRALCNQFNEQAEMRIDRHIDAGVEVASPEAELVVYRVAQEALTNVARHAGVDVAALGLAQRDGTVELVVSDQGRGFRVDASAPTVGIRGMRERAVLVGADLDLQSSPGAGTTVRLVVPAAAPA